MSMSVLGKSEFSLARGAGEGNHVADVGHAGDEEHETLKSETEAE